MADFFFFTDIDLLQSQPANKAYGQAGVASGLEKFRVSSLHSATGTPQAYAVCDGVVCVQQDASNASLVNLILKPNQNPDINFSTIKYIIYKGILKNSLFDGSGNITVDSTNNLTESIKHSWDAYIAGSGEPVTLASEKALGIDLVNTTSNYVNTDPIDNLFYLTAGNFHFPSVQGGWVIGKFNPTEFGLTIITERIGYDPKIKLARETENFVEVSQLPGGATNAQTFEHWHNKEEILNFIDPCAFYGMFYPLALSAKTIVGTFTKNKKNEIYDNILKGLQHSIINDGNFFNRNTIYLDIRNEHNQSFNYYKNYGTQIEISYDGTITPIATDYYLSGWPLYSITNSVFPLSNTSTKNEIYFTLPAGDNPAPIAIILNGYVKRYNPFRKLKGKKRYVDLDIIGSFTEKIKLLNPNRDSLTDTTVISHHILITYNKRLNEDLAPQISTGTKIESNYYFDNVFFPLAMKSPFNSTSGSDIKVYNEGTYIDQLDTGREFLAHTSIIKDVSGIAYFFYANDRRVKFGFSHRKFYAFSTEKNTTSDYFGDVLNKKFPNIELEEGELNLSSGIIQLIGLNSSIDKFLRTFNSPFTSELFILYLSNNELITINNLISLNSLLTDYKISIGFINKTSQFDIDDKEYITYDLALKGFINNSTDINSTEVNTNIKLYQNVS